MRVRPCLIAGLLACLVVLAACGGGHSNPFLSTPSTQSQPSTTAATLSSVAVTPTAPSMPLGTKQQFTATGTYSDGSTKDLTASATWASDSAAVSVNASGMATAASTGSAHLSATLGSVAGSTTVTVTSAALDHITIAPPNPSASTGSTVAFTASAVMSDGTSADVTASASFSSSVPAIATMAGNVAYTLSQGSTSITASYQSKTATAALNVSGSAVNTTSGVSVTPANATLGLGQTQQYKGTLTLADSTTTDVTATCNWSSADTTIVSITNPGGTATAAAQGNTSIQCNWGPLSGSTGVTVGPPVLTSIVVSPASATIGVHQEQVFTAQGYFSDGSNSQIAPNWSSSDPNVCFSSCNGVSLPNGVAFGAAATSGAATITASLNGVNGTATLTVNGSVTLTTIDVSPNITMVGMGGTAQFTALGTWSDSSTQDVTTNPGVTWAESDVSGTNVASVGAHTGLADGLNPGTASITAADGNVSGLGTLIVTTATLQSIDVQPHNPIVTSIQKQQFTAVGTFSDGSTGPVAVTWASDNTGVATIDANAGLATPVHAGTANISATCGPVQGCASSISGQTQLTVSGANLIGIVVTPANPSVGIGATKQFAATAQFDSSGPAPTTSDVTNIVTWTSTNLAGAPSTVATISNSGLATTLALGKATIMATFGQVSGSTVLTVTPAQMEAMIILPSTMAPACSGMWFDGSTPCFDPVSGLPNQPNLSMTAHTKMQLVAYGYFTDKTFQTLSGVIWSTPPPKNVITLTGSGVVISKPNTSGGTRTITATKGSIIGSASLTVAGDITGVTITPNPGTVAAGTGLQFTATMTGNSLVNLTNVVHWSTGGITCATINATGFANGLLPGNCSVTVTATYYNQLGSSPVSGTATLNVTNYTLQSIAVTPADQTIPLGMNLQMFATGTFVDPAGTGPNTTEDLTSQVAWSSSDVTVVVMSATTPGLATSSGPTTPGAAPQTATITAAVDGVSGSTSLTVDAPPLP